MENNLGDFEKNPKLHAATEILSKTTLRVYKRISTASGMWHVLQTFCYQNLHLLIIFQSLKGSAYKKSKVLRTRKVHPALFLKNGFEKLKHHNMYRFSRDFFPVFRQNRKMVNAYIGTSNIHVRKLHWPFA